MFDSKAELLEKIRLGEDSLIEFKAVRFTGDSQKIQAPARDGLADEIAAFANSAGGVLLLGVDDKTRDVEGVPLDRLDAAESLVREVCNDKIKPPVAPSIIRFFLPNESGEEKAIVKVDVSRSLFVHLSPGGYLHRIGSSKRVMAPDYLARLFQQRSQTRLIRFDEQAVPNATLDHLVPELWERFQTPRTSDAREDFLFKQGLARQDENATWLLTVAGVLMTTRDPRHWLPNAFIQAVAYQGLGAVPDRPDATYQLDAKDIAGSLDNQIVDACRFVARNTRVAARKDAGRIDLPQFDMTAVFEAVVNAVAHRDYSIHGAKIQLHLFRDRLELYSPGSLPNTMTEGSMIFRQAARNEVLTSLLARCSVPDEAWLSTDRRMLMDKRGEGVRIILERSEAASGIRPEYRLLDDAELCLTIYGRAENAEK